MKTENQHHPFTLEQLNALSAEQRQAIEAVAEYLTDNTMAEENLTDEEISSIFNLLKPIKGCVPNEEIGDNLLSIIRRKFSAVYQVGMELAEAELKSKKISGFNFCYLSDPSYEDTTHIAIVDFDRPICYLHEWTKAWHLSFAALIDLANEVLQVKKQLVEIVTKNNPKEIFVVMEGGVVHQIVNLPDGINVTVIDYDIEDVEKERLEISPVDGELCVINKW